MDPINALWLMLQVSDQVTFSARADEEESYLEIHMFLTNDEVSTLRIPRTAAPRTQLADLITMAWEYAKAKSQEDT